MQVRILSSPQLLIKNSKVMVYLFRFLVSIFIIIVVVFIRPVLLLLLDMLWSLKPHGLKYYWSYAGDFLFDEWFIKDVIYFIKNGYVY